MKGDVFFVTREEYYEKVKIAIKEHFDDSELPYWNNARWQEVIAKMYDDFSSFTTEQQDQLIAQAGPKEPFWDRVVMDAAYTYYMLF